MGKFSKYDALKRRAKRIELTSMKKQEAERKFFLKRCQDFDFCPLCKGYGTVEEKKCGRCLGSGFFYNENTGIVDRKNTEIFNQPHQMWAEGSEKTEPGEESIQKLLEGEGLVADEIEIWFDTLQELWRWSCKIEKA